MALRNEVPHTATLSASGGWRTDKSRPQLRLRLHVHNILDAYIGRAAIAEAAAAFFADSPDLAFERGRVHLGDDHIVSEYVMSGTLLGRPFACDGTDILSLRDGLVARKDSYIDWLTYQGQTGADMTQQGVRSCPPWTLRTSDDPQAPMADA